MPGLTWLKAERFWILKDRNHHIWQLARSTELKTFLEELSLYAIEFAIALPNCNSRII